MIRETSDLIEPARIDRCFQIGPVAEEEVEVLDLQAFERGVARIANVLAVQAALGR
jgi:hypothetical protein